MMPIPGGRFLSARAATLAALPAVVILGLPFDGTCSFRPGSRFAPAALREVSLALETYSPVQDRDLEDLDLGDLGDLELPFGNVERCLELIHRAAVPIFASPARPLFVGGEHLVSLPLIQAAAARHPDLAVIHFDAHADLRPEYLGETLSHATVMRRVAEEISPEDLYQFGIRSGTREEYDYGRARTNFYPGGLEAAPRVLAGLRGRPLYLSLDLDVLDPAYFPGTGTPEPGGVTFADLHQALLAFAGHRVVGVDIVELSPPSDPAGIATITAAKVARELLLLSATFC